MLKGTTKRNTKEEEEEGEGREYKEYLTEER